MKKFQMSKDFYSKILVTPKILFGIRNKFLSAKTVKDGKLNFKGQIKIFFLLC